MTQSEREERSIRMGMKVLVVLVVVVAVSAGMPALKADTGGFDVVSTGHSLVAPPAFGLTELTVFPNPCRVVSKIRYRLTAAATAVNIKIYDTAGRLIRSLAGSTVSGANTVDWDLASNEGSGVPSGVYFVKVTAHGAGAKTVDRTKIAVLR
ncbi:MAG: T9SS type A sorting domain-containing protein [Candidatus Riflebacteria bacterium]|nr:T9SS type A sorting domain-containing protein [Candidatus Riflebacteria bacterium]